MIDAEFQRLLKLIYEASNGDTKKGARVLQGIRGAGTAVSDLVAMLILRSKDTKIDLSDTSTRAQIYKSLDPIKDPWDGSRTTGIGDGRYVQTIPREECPGCPNCQPDANQNNETKSDPKTGHGSKSVH